jgi:membrane protein implicated in regulation of membrane protease activity
MRSPLAILREIRRNSRRVERNVFDRVQGAGFVAFAFVAPLVVWKMQSWSVRETSETLMIVRIYESIPNAGERGVLGAVEIRAKERDAPWKASLPLADADLVQRTEWRGWPLVTSHTNRATELNITRMATCPASREPEVRKAAMQVVERNGRFVAGDVAHTHVASWVFSSGAWWIMLSMALAVALAPVRLCWRLFRRTRTLVRQGRIDRCHCPNCGYNAKHSIMRGRCPECGSELYERPDYD